MGIIQEVQICVWLRMKCEEMRLLIVRPHGSVINIHNYNVQEIGLAKAFWKAGIECDIVFFCGKQKSWTQEIHAFDDKYIKIYWLNGISILNNAIIPAVFELTSKYDIIWVNEFNQYTSYRLAKTFPGKVCIYHGPYPKKYSTLRYVKETILEKVFFSQKIADRALVFAKSNMARSHLKKIGFPKVVTIGVGLDVERFQNPKKNKFLQYEIPEFAHILLSIGTIEERKNTFFLLKVLNQLVKQDNRFRLILVGKKDETYWSKCEKYISNNNIEKNIIYIEKLTQEELPELYKISTAFLFPTLYDIFGMVLLEAMYFGLPVISTSNGGADTLIQDGVNGYIRELTVEKWSEAICKIAYKKEEAQAMAQKASDEITSNYTWDAIVEKVIKYL